MICKTLEISKISKLCTNHFTFWREFFVYYLLVVQRLKHLVENIRTRELIEAEFSLKEFWLKSKEVEKHYNTTEYTFCGKFCFILRLYIGGNHF